MKKSMYYQKIKEILEAKVKSEIDPRHIEANMRIVYSTLDGLSAKHFEKEVLYNIMIVESSPIEQSEKLAQSFGL